MSARDKCYTCVHRREVPGSAHSSCRHPATADAHAQPIAGLLTTFGKRSGLDWVPTPAAGALHIEGAAPGIAGGWFLWPFNFDPVWLERCDGYTAVEALAAEEVR